MKTVKGIQFKSVVVIATVTTAFAISNIQVQATPDYAKKEKKTCNYCHSVDKDGGPRGFRGTYYKAHKLSFKGFDEKKEAKKAGVKPNAMGSKSKATKPYTGK